MGEKGRINQAPVKALLGALTKIFGAYFNWELGDRVVPEYQILFQSLTQNNRLGNYNSI